MQPTSPKLASATPPNSHLFYGLRLLFVAGLMILSAATARAIHITEYHRHIRQAVSALDALAQSDETESDATYAIRDTETVQGVRNLLPPTESVESNGEIFNVDNSWLHKDLDVYASDRSKERYHLLRRITERLKALDDRITELEMPAAVTTGSKAERSRKLAEILKRPEYALKVTEQSALTRLVKQFLEWLLNLFPKPKPLSPGSAGFLTQIAQVFIVLLAVAVLAYVVRLFLPRLLRSRRPAKKTKQEARIVLGEKLEPNQSATDLLSEAEALARRGELRAAIRKAYIALLVELGDRKIISLAQYKTNRDYLRAVRKVQPLYADVKLLTDSFEQHWYGLASATESDWLAFRSAYKQALRR